MQRRKVVLKLVLLIGILQGSISLVTSKCDGVCVKMEDCDNDFGGIYTVNLRFGEEDYVEAECPHYLDVCCDVDKVVTTRAPPVSNESSEEGFGAPSGGAETPKPIDGEENPKPIDGEENPKPIDGEENPKPVDGKGTSNRNGDGNNLNENNADQDEVKSGSNNNAGTETVVSEPTAVFVEEPSSNSAVEPMDGEGHSLTRTQFGECGMRNPEGVRIRLENPKHNETEFGEFPWMVAILQSQSDLEQSESSYTCGGSLIAPNVVLTAAHCVMDKDPQKLTVRAGEWDTMTTKEALPHQEQPVSRIILHPHFNRNMMFHDVALLVLQEPFSAAENVQCACLPPQGKVFNSNECFAAGWGKTAFDDQSYHAILKRVPLPMMPKQECQNALRTTRLGPRFRLHESFICAGGQDGVDTCTGDGGSPLVCPVEGSANKYYQAGIVAWGINCGQAGIPGVYVQASMYTNWIDEELNKINYMSVDRRNNMNE